MQDIEKMIRAAFLSIPGIGSRKLRQLIANFGSAEAAWHASNQDYHNLGTAAWIQKCLQQKAKIDPDKIGRQIMKQGISMTIPGDKEYPHLLSELADAPPLLFFMGGELAPFQETLALVGSRHATPYGKAAAAFLARELAYNGIVIVSGLARGIDTFSHKGALEANGSTWAFLGCGLDQIYPSENKDLAKAIMKKGMLFSEYPPGTPPAAGHFPARNRLISGSSRGVVVVEAAERSGALITVDFALEQGREVFAVPGPIFSETSRGTHNLLRSGAKIVEGIEDIWAEIPDWPPSLNKESLQVDNRGKVIESGKNNVSKEDDLEPKKEQKILLELLSDIPMHIDNIVLKTELVPSVVALALLELQLEGKIEQLPGQWYVLARRAG